MPLAPSPADASAFTVQTQQRTQRKSPSIGELSIVQRSSTTVEVRGHDTAFPSFLGTSEYFYDSRAGACSLILTRGDYLTIAQLAEHAFILRLNNNARPFRYENPLITAASRSLISDIHTLTRRCCAVDVPRPLSLLHTLLRARPPNELFDDPWFKAVRIWAEVDDICETESFDGHKKSFVEYTLNILFFPDLHTRYRVPKILVLRRPPPSPADSQLSLSVPSSPSLPVPGMPCSIPSPLHFQLPVMTRLCFNEQGQITYHRDIWDFRDVIRLIPGVRVVLWIVARAGAWGLSWISQKVCSNMDADAQHEECVNEDNALLTSLTDSNV